MDDTEQLRTLMTIEQRVRKASQWLIAATAVLFFIVMLFGAHAHAGATLDAGTPVFTWTNPTQQYTDKPGVVCDPVTAPANCVFSPIPATGPQALKETRLFCNLVGQPVSATPTKTIAFPTLTWATAFGDFAQGTYSCQATAVQVNGSESIKSNILNVPCPNCKPPTPGTVTGLGVN